MAKILSLLREVEGGEPAIFEIGKAVEDDGLPVSKIQFKRDAALGAYRGPCYLVYYGDSDRRTVIPAGRVIDLMVDEQTKKKEEEVIPPLPTAEE
jgi:hypothetical protein